MLKKLRICNVQILQVRKKWKIIIRRFLFNSDIVFNGNVEFSPTKREDFIIHMFIFFSVGTYCPAAQYAVPFTGYIFSWKDTPTGTNDLLPCPLNYFGKFLWIDWVLVVYHSLVCILHTYWGQEQVREKIEDTKGKVQRS